MDTYLLIAIIVWVVVLGVMIYMARKSPVEIDADDVTGALFGSAALSVLWAPVLILLSLYGIVAGIAWLLNWKKKT